MLCQIIFNLQFSCDFGLFLTIEMRLLGVTLVHRLAFTKLNFSLELLIDGWLQKMCLKKPTGS